MDFKDYPDSEMMMIDLANILAGEIENMLFSQDTVSLAVPGGTTPGPIFDTLSATNLDWSRVHVMLTDERWVPEASDRSNTRLLRERLFTGHAAHAHLIPLYSDAPSPEDALDALTAGVNAHLPLSICLLGMGADMHTASIFPEADQLTKALYGDDVLVPMRAPGAPEPRVTLSAKTLNSALNKHVVIIGDEKRKAFDAARVLDPDEAPIMAVLKGATVHWAES